MTTSATDARAETPGANSSAPAPREVVAAARTLALGLGLFAYVALLLGALPDPPVRQMVAGAVAFGALAFALVLKVRQESRRATPPPLPRPHPTAGREAARIAGLLLVGGGYLSLMSWIPVIAFAGIVGGILLYRRGTASAPREWEIPTVLVLGAAIAFVSRGTMDRTLDRRRVEAILPALASEFGEVGLSPPGMPIRFTFRPRDAATADRFRTRVRALIGSSMPAERQARLLWGVSPVAPPDPPATSTPR